MSKILDGVAIASDVLREVKNRADACAAKGVRPGLATVLVGDDPASHVYVGQKIKKCEANGLVSIHRPLPASISQQELLAVVNQLNNDNTVHGIIVQLPLPKNIDAESIIRSVDPKKDADGLHPLNQGIIGRLKSWEEIQMSGIPIPCTPAGVIQILLASGIEVEGKNAVVVGRSTLVGKPVAQLLLSLNATVTIAHSKTPNLNQVCANADILIAAIGIPKFIKAEAVKVGAVVIDVGINRTDSGLVGDVDYENVRELASYITPVPKGVGPMTVAMLLLNTVRAAEQSLN